jgi:ABC-type uncharacterized transport system ATPase subunit
MLIKCFNIFLTSSSFPTQDLTFSYPSRNSFVTEDPVNILDNLSISLPRGARCLLLGSNGSGKVREMFVTLGSLLHWGVSPLRIAKLIALF